MNMDPHRHLAFEEALLDLPGDAPPVVYFWRSRPAVVIGKNQIPWREADLGWMQKHRVLLCRRASGGGAVYHDEGNLNWSVCASRDRYSARLVTDCCLDALSAAGVRAQAAGAASLVSGGAKISGMAYAYRRNRVLHHGTLLADADLGQLRRALRPPAATWETHAVRSEPMHVRNVGEKSAEHFQQALLELFLQYFPDGVRLDENPMSLQVDDHASRHKSREWILGRTPKFRCEIRLQSSCTPIRASVNVEHGRVQTGSLIECADETRSLRVGAWFGSPILSLHGSSAPLGFAAFGDPDNWGDQ